MRITMVLATLMIAASLAAGCDNDGPMENAGEAIDDAAQDMGDAVENACEDIKEGAGAEDEDC